MDKYYVLKRVLYTNLDIIQLDIKTLDATISDICNIPDVLDSNIVCTLLQNAVKDIIDCKIKKIIEIIASNVINDEEYKIDNVILNIYQLKSYLIVKKSVYKKYIRMVEKV